jgi:outer membrane protein assembly factor BamB
VLAAALVLGHVLSWLGALEIIGRGGRSSSATPRNAPMVKVDDELVTFLGKAEKLINEKSYAEAVEILQAMMSQQKELGFLPTEEASRFISFRVRVNELIGKMDAEGLKKYRAVAESQAQRLYESACAKGSTGLLREVADRYLHTSYGPLALETLAEVHFDRGQFSQAAYCWRQLLRVLKDKSGEPELLAKLAAAHHLAGETETAGEIAADLQTRFPQAKGSFGGRQENLLAFVQRVRTMKSGFSTTRRDAQRGWPGLGALPGNYGTMADCDVAPQWQWRYPDPASVSGDALSSLIASKGLFSTFNYPGTPRPTFSTRLRGGHVQVKFSVNPGYEGISSGTVRAGQETALPPPIHPVVVGETIIFRDDKGLTALDLLSGQKLWEAFGLPLERKVEVSNMGGYYYGGYAMGGLCDSGRYALTVADGKVFTLAGFLPSVGQNPYMLQRNPNLAKELADVSSLAAVSLEAEGMLVWRVGEGRGDDDIIKGCKFLSAPSYHSGRLYVLAIATENYWLICLNADTGAKMWIASVAQTPAVYRGYYPGQGSYLDMGSIPAVADGRVFVLTNTGVVAAYEAESGQPIWAYQYDSYLSGSTGRMSYQPRQGMGRPANPVIVAGGKVMILPADGSQVIALSAQDGKCLWKADRQSQNDLTGIDDDRVLISGDRLTMLSTVDGKKLPKSVDESSGDYSQKADKIVGRPAVTTGAVLASGDGKIYRLDLKTYRLSDIGTVDANALLGNLLAVDGKLIAANAAGLCSYFNYDATFKQITDKMSTTEGKDRARAYQQRASLAFGSQRFSQALEDYLTCMKLAEEAGDSSLQQMVRPLLYRTYVALGNHAEKDEEMLAMFRKAQGLAETAQEKAHMLLRVAKYCQKVGEFAKAVELAQEISEKYGTEELTDFPIGKEADDAVSTTERTKTVRGKHLAQTFIRSVIEVHGRDSYAKFDAEAAEALKKARAASDPEAMLGVTDRWPNSSSADEAQFAAAETYYLKAAADKDKADEYYGLAIQYLSDVSNLANSPRKVSATVALAILYARGNKQIAARLTCEQVKGLPADTPVEFADIKGKLGAMIEDLERGKVPTASVKVRFVAAINPPLKEQFKIAEETLVLRDQDFQPVRIGEGVFVLRGNRAVLLDASARNVDDATQRWVGLTSLEPEQTKQNPHVPPGMRLIAGMSIDGNYFVVADRNAATGFEVDSAKRAWHTSMADLGVGQFYCMGVGDSVLVVCDTVGKIVCVDMAKGDVRWTSNLVGGQPRQPYGSPVIGGSGVLVRHNNGRSLTCLSVTSGKVLNKWDGTYVEGLITKDGIVAILLDGKLSVYEIGQLDKPLWAPKDYGMSAGACILALESERIAISRGLNSTEIDVLSVMTGGELAKLSTGRVENAPIIPLDGSFGGSSFYVTGSMNSMGRRRSAYGQVNNSRGLIVQRFELNRKSADPAWTASIETNLGVIFNVLPLTVGQKHVALTAKHTQYGVAYHTYVLDGQTGDVKEKFDLMGQANVTKDQLRRGLIGQPVMTNGRLLVETTEGVSVYGGQ